MFKTNLPALTL